MEKRKSKFIIFLLLISFFFSLTACQKDNLTDAQKFKEEYESLNGQKTSNGKEYRNILIDEKNPMIYKTEDDIVKAIQNKETFVIYFGFASCPWCRSILETLIEVSKEESLSQIYYVDISNIRDTYEIKNGKLEKTKEGTEGYYKLLDLFKDKLEDYKITDDAGKTTDTGEKRIYAPNIVGVIDGEIFDITTGISSLEKDPYMQLTEEIKNEMHSKISPIIKKISEELSSCDISGC